jgi:small-conductance mechanosensitive channel
VVNKQMSFRSNDNGSLADWLWCAIIVLVSRVSCESAIEMVNKQSIWRNKKGALAGFLLWAIIIVVLIIVLIVVLRFLLGVI